MATEKQVKYLQELRSKLSLEAMDTAFALALPTQAASLAIKNLIEQCEANGIVIQRRGRPWGSFTKPQVSGVVQTPAPWNTPAPTVAPPAAPAPIQAPWTNKPEPTQPETAPSSDAEKLASLIRSLTANSVSPEAVRSIVAEELAKLPPPSNGVTVKIELKTSTSVRTLEGLAHKQFPVLLQMLAAGVNVWLAGPAGSGKTIAARKAAEALGLNFYFNGAIDNEYKLLGFTDAQGRIVSRPFREAFIHGGVYLFDEVDASMPNAVLAFNAALANGHCDFPDGNFAKHPDFRVIAAANTYGQGATADYVGRAKQDAAFLDRFVFLAWEYDVDLERAIAGNDEWVSYVQQVRANIARHGIKVIVSPRASFAGAAMLAAGIDRATVIATCVRKSMTNEQWNSVK